MIESLLLHPLLLSLLGLGAAIIMYKKRQLDNGSSRLILSIWFAWLYFMPDVDPTTSRVVGRWVVGAMLLVEIVSYLVLSYYRRKYKDALDPLEPGE